MGMNMMGVGVGMHMDILIVGVRMDDERVQPELPPEGRTIACFGQYSHPSCYPSLPRPLHLLRHPAG
jgi:hypothetical protein